VEAELVGDLSGVHGIGQILLVGEHEKEGVPELILGKHTLDCCQPRRRLPLTLLPGFGDTLPVVGVNDEDNTLSVLEVCGQRRLPSLPTVSPEGTDLVLSSNIPYGE
jgi:hypothetical protein